MEHVPKRSGHGVAGLALGALGVVFGDIGTSPLYALQTVFSVDHNMVATSAGDVFGVISLVFWSVTLVVSVKYVVFILRADNDGEGGVMALAALARTAVRPGGRRYGLVMLLGVLGASLFYGDSVITPAISVMSAIEGLSVSTRGAAPGGAHRRGDHHVALRRSAVRDRARGTVLRARHGPVVRGPRPARRRAGRQGPLDPGRTVAHLRGAVRRGAPRASRSSPWAPSCCRSPAPRRCMPTWATSARLRSVVRGSSSSFPRSR